MERGEPNYTEDQLLPLSALQHWLFCPRQCGLIHLEQVWAENKFTAEGQVLHQKAHEGADESKAEVRITRSLSVRSFALGISGQCDVVEFHLASGSASGDLRGEISDLRGRASETADELHEGDFKSQTLNLKSATPRVLPVEYKRGKPKLHRADEVQLCAQAMCLEEMLEVTIRNGFLFYGEKRRRTPIEFDSSLRQLVSATAAELHAMIASRETPLAEYESRRCDACSLIELCQPKAMRFKRGAQAWFDSHLKSQI
ncbi:MAG: CRISPR-associated protein Cas4 [Akkermansiaceae bacterium]|nr:CRISPR-associated protein Cas4 [Akkermansiaceae bacterium]